jgi:hypothetical protein
MEKNLSLQKKWEEILNSEGLSSALPSTRKQMAKAGFQAASLEEEARIENNITKALDQAIITENQYSSEIPLNRSGLPPCLRAKQETLRNPGSRISRRIK